MNVMLMTQILKYTTMILNKILLIYNNEVREIFKKTYV